MAVVVHQHPPARQYFALQPDRVAHRPQPHPMAEHARPGDLRPQRRTPFDDRPGRHRIRRERPVVLVGRATQHEPVRVREDIGGRPGVRVRRHEPGADPRVLHDHELPAHGPYGRIRYERVGAQPRAVDDDRRLDLREIRHRPYLDDPACLEEPLAQPPQMHRHVDQRQPRPQPRTRVLLGRRRPQPRHPGGPRLQLVQPCLTLYALDHAYARLLWPGRQLLVHGE